MEQQDFDRACRFINALVAAVQRHGVSSSSMELLLVRVTRALGLKGQFLATPTQVQSIIWDSDEDNQRLHISVAKAGNYDLCKLAQISEVVGQVEAGLLDPVSAQVSIRAIDRADPVYGPAVEALSFILCGLGFGVILGGTWLEVALGGAVSLASFALKRMAARSESLNIALELVVAAVAAALATILTLEFPGIDPVVVTVCAIIFFVPGFGLTLGASELMNGNTLSGLLGFVSAAVASLKLVMGLLIGSALVRDVMSMPAPVDAPGVPDVWTWAFAPLLVLGLAILFRVRLKDMGWPLLAGIVVWAGVQLGAGFGYWQGTFIGAFLLMGGARLFARLSGLSATIILLPAVMLLVPGVAALGALYDVQSLGAAAGLKSTVEFFVLVAALLGGLLCGDAVWSINNAAVATVNSKIVHRTPENEK